MKHFTLFFLTLGIIPLGLTQLNEDFNSGIPANWTQWSGDGITWTSSATLGVGGTGCAIADQGASSNMGVAWLHTPFMDLTQLTSPEITLSAAVVQNNFTAPTFSLWYDIGGGWNQITTGWAPTQSTDLSPPLDAANINWNNLSMDLSAFGTSTNIRFSFGSDFSNGGWVLVDDVVISGSSVVQVASITVQGQGGVSTITTAGGNLQMEETVLPGNASDNTVAWSVTNGTGSAIINPSSGLLIAVTNGTVIVRATANDGSGIFGETVVTLSNQNVGLHDKGDVVSIQLYPNPASEVLHISSNSKIDKVQILSIDGKEIEHFSNEDMEVSVNVQAYSRGMYFIVVQTGEEWFSIPFARE